MFLLRGLEVRYVSVDEVGCSDVVPITPLMGRMDAERFHQMVRKMDRTKTPLRDGLDGRP